MSIVRVSILRCEPARFAMFSKLMAEAEATLEPGIRSVRGCRLYFAGADEASSSLTNVSVWDTLDDAKQMDAGARFERPIINYEKLWQLGEI